MSTRTRMLLKDANGINYTGNIGVKALIQLTQPKLGTVGVRKFLSKLGGSKKEKLLELAKALPPNYTLILIQEPRRTRKNRSLYWELRTNRRIG